MAWAVYGTNGLSKESAQEERGNAMTANSFTVMAFQ